MRSAKQLQALAAPTKAIKPKLRTPDDDLRIYGPPEFREWLHRQPCAVCGWHDGNPKRMHQCHAKTGGTARKDDWTRTFPGCGPHFAFPAGHAVIDGPKLVDGCHVESGCGVKSFEKKHGVVLLELAAETQRRWRASAGCQNTKPCEAANG